MKMGYLMVRITVSAGLGYDLGKIPHEDFM